MLYIVVAHSAEARAIVDNFKLKRVHLLPFTLFENERVKLVISGMGNENAMMATSALLGCFAPGENDLLINIGICGAPGNFKIGDALLAHKIIYHDHYSFGDILFEHELHECDLLCVDEPVTSNVPTVVDMESYGVYKAASRFLKTHQILFFKVVSDHFEPDTVTKEMTIELMAKNMQKLQTIILDATDTMHKENIFNEQERILMQKIAVHLTKSQTDAFLDACHYYKLHHKKSLDASEIRPPDTKLSKQQRGEYCEQLIKTLTL
jgi:nucleoside phosphorylase